MPVDADAFRAVFGTIPTPVAIITALGADSEPRGFTCNAFSAVSASPPLLLVCVGKGSQTLPAMLSSGVFAVNFVAGQGQDVAVTFAGKGTRKFDGVPWHGGLAGAPVLTEAAVAYAGCTLVQSMEAGDHRLLIGRVEETEIFPREAVLYQRGVFGTWEPASRLTAPQR
ncbi:MULTISPECIES: flavin reductase family protein [unclassified Streptomyces]|uniref:flavin reductase family protein n=1 Tax=unclassified Streptomyces TaxID=2593676 RepID=UPI002E764AE8|nr:MULTISPECIES: flavin reductase family protein [unclassified Streptomyces]MEE1758257.1 flavin reductase family protein [Streptomyces sp. SP18BB07]MEE1832687.1 flavin reductase family protein [Streptomyces sp. SP17KL33]